MSFFMYQASYIGPSYALLHPFYIRWSLFIECHSYYYGSILCTLIIVGLILLYIRWSLYIRCHTYYYGSILCTPVIVGYSCT